VRDDGPVGGPVVAAFGLLRPGLQLTVVEVGEIGRPAADAAAFEDDLDRRLAADADGVNVNMSKFAKLPSTWHEV